MKSRPLETSIIDSTGFKTPFRTTSEIRRYLNRELERWDWLKDAPHSRHDMSVHILGNLRRLIGRLDDFDANRIPDHEFISDFQALYAGPQPGLIQSESNHGAAILAMRKSLSDDEAEMAAAMATRQIRPDIESLREFRIWQFVANPALINFDARLGEHSSKLRKIRQDHERSLVDFEEKSLAALASVAETLRKDRKGYGKILRSGLRMAKRKSQAMKELVNDSIDKINNTERTYSEYMHLKAPVTYWESKGARHEVSSTNAVIALGLFVVISVVLSVFSLHFAWNTLGDGKAFTGKHFLLVAGVGSFLTLIFWIARVLMKIYLAERHLRTDAEERRIMKLTYLALLNESAASPDERILVLSSLFRSAQDGIVKDDSGADLSLPAVLAKMLDGRGAR